MIERSKTKERDVIINYMKGFANEKDNYGNVSVLGTDRYDRLDPLV